MTNKIGMTFGEIYREEFGGQMDQQTLANKIGISKPRCSRIMTSKVRIHPDVAKRLADILNVPQLYILNIAELCYVSCNYNKEIAQKQPVLVDRYRKLHGQDFLDSDEDDEQPLRPEEVRVTGADGN